MICLKRIHDVKWVYAIAHVPVLQAIKAIPVVLGVLLTLSACSAIITQEAATPGRRQSSSIFDDIVSSHFDPHGPGASVIVAKHGRILFRKAYGLADIEQNILLQSDDLFQIGSLTKQFTATAIMLLVQEGKLALSEPITRYLPDSPSVWQKITIEHLLTHTSGIVDYTKLPGFLENINKEKSLSQLIAVFKDEPLQFAPGSKFAYSNSGYVLLGAIIERVSGLPYYEFMARNIFIPLGLSATSVKNHERGEWIARSAGVKGYRRDELAPSVNTSQSYAVGSLVTNVDDLVRWDTAIAEGKLLGPENWRKVFSPYRLPGGELTTYGYGWFLSSRAGHPSAEHFGATSGFSCAVLRMPQDGIYVAVLTNKDLGNLLSAVGAVISQDDPSTLAAKLAESALSSD